MEEGYAMYTTKTKTKTKKNKNKQLLLLPNSKWDKAITN